MLVYLKAGEEVRPNNHRKDERLIVELMNPPLSVPIPRVDLVMLYFKDLSAYELTRVRAFNVSVPFDCYVTLD